MEPRATADDWRRFATTVLQRAGLPPEPASAVARGLVAGDLYGHSTHGLALLADYVEEIRAGTMATDGGPEPVADSGAVVTWDARRLPGVWTTMLAVEEATARAGRYGVGAVAIRRSHHIACLAAYLEGLARAGYLVQVFSSDPSDAHVAPFGGLTPVMTPNPIAAGIPADPAALKNGGSILPIGGRDHGHKGFALSLLVEALTQGLSGYGRADQPRDWGAAVLVLAFAPARFAGLEAFSRQTTWLAEASRNARPRDPRFPVRLPGQLALERKRAAERDGLQLAPAIVKGLAALATHFELPLPDGGPTGATAPPNPSADEIRRSP